VEADGAVEDVEVHGDVGGGRRDLPSLDDAVLPLLILLRSHRFLPTARGKKRTLATGTGAAGSRRIEEVPRRTTGNPESSRLSLRDSRGFVNFEN
jgi:hypothetical protein